MKYFIFYWLFFIAAYLIQDIVGQCHDDQCLKLGDSSTKEQVCYDTYIGPKKLNVTNLTNTCLKAVAESVESVEEVSTEKVTPEDCKGVLTDLSTVLNCLKAGLLSPNLTPSEVDDAVQKLGSLSKTTENILVFTNCVNTSVKNTTKHLLTGVALYTNCLATV